MTSDYDYRYNSLLETMFISGEEVEVGEWQSQDVSDKPEMISKELRHVTFRMPVPNSMEMLQDEVKPNLPWAEDHFLERVSGEPLNPPPSEAWWPFRVNGNALHKQEWEFSHTYPERIWPRYAGELRSVDKNQVNPHKGIKYHYGDLMDLVNLLVRNPQSRQAYLPIWFPEDLGAASINHRVPCTLGYHFLIRDGKAEIVYYIRSCDMLRHFTDDVYMACRLLQWVVGKLRENEIHVNASKLIMHISSLHIFRGDYPKVRDMLDKFEPEESYGAAI